jgi:hypothetical protein
MLMAQLVTTSYHHILEAATSDDLIEWYALVIWMTWADKIACIPPQYERALEKALHCGRQQLIRKAVSHDRTRKICDEYVG